MLYTKLTTIDNASQIFNFNPELARRLHRRGMPMGHHRQVTPAERRQGMIDEASGRARLRRLWLDEEKGGD